MEGKRFSASDITKICEAAISALGENGRTTLFTWSGETYRAERTSFRITVDDAKGRPVACRYN